VLLVAFLTVAALILRPDLIVVVLLGASSWLGWWPPSAG